MQNQITFAGAIKKGFLSWRDYRGVSTRGEYWYFELFRFLLSIVLSTIDALISRGDSGNPFFTLSTFAAIILVSVRLPLSVRRLHDAGFSGWWLATGFLPCALIAWKLPVIISLFQNPVFKSQTALDELSDKQLMAIGLQMLDAFGWAFLAFMLVGIFLFVLTLLPSRPSWRGNKYAPVTSAEPVWGYQQVWGYQPVWGYTVNGKFYAAPDQAPKPGEVDESGTGSADSENQAKGNSDPSI